MAYPSPTLQDLTVNGNTSLSTVSNANIQGGSIDSTPIGATTASSVKATTINSSGAATLNSVSTASATITGGTINGTDIGGTTPAAGNFSTGSFSSTLTIQDSAGTNQPVSQGQLASTATGKGAALVAWIASGLSAIARNLLDKVRERPSVVDYGADPTGVASSVAAFNAALTANDDVFIPPGTYLIDDAVSVPSGKRLRGAGRRKTILSMPSTFNASAAGALVLGTTEPSAWVSDLTIIQDQPDSTTPTVYPPMIYAQASPRFRIERVRLAPCYIGIDMKMNSGGSDIVDLEIAPLSIGIDIDGSQDSVKIDRMQMWVFGGAGATQLTTNQKVSYDASYGIKVGRCDDFHLTNSLMFEKTNALYCYLSASGKVFGQVSNCGFDARGGLYVAAGSLQVSNGYFSINFTDAYCVNVPGGVVLLDNCSFYIPFANSGINGQIAVSAGGSLSLSNCRIDTAATDQHAVYGTASLLSVTGSTFKRNTNIAYTNEMVSIDSGTGVISGNQCASLGTGSGNFVKTYTDSGFSIFNNVLNGNGIVTVSGALTNTLVDKNLGGAAGSNKEQFAGYFSSDATTTVRLPSGWSVTKQATGRYLITHNLNLNSVYDIGGSFTPESTTNTNIIIDTTNSNVNAMRIATSVGSTATDMGVFFQIKRNRT